MQATKFNFMWRLQKQIICSAKIFPPPKKGMCVSHPPYCRKMRSWFFSFPDARECFGTNFVDGAFGVHLCDLLTFLTNIAGKATQSW